MFVVYVGSKEVGGVVVELKHSQFSGATESDLQLRESGWAAQSGEVERQRPPPEHV
jgi:hypothetical protein